MDFYTLAIRCGFFFYTTVHIRINSTITKIEFFCLPFLYGRVRQIILFNGNFHNVPSKGSSKKTTNRGDVYVDTAISISANL